MFWQKIGNSVSDRLFRDSVIHTYIHTQTYIQMYMHAFIHACTHTVSYIRFPMYFVPKL